MWYEQTIFYQIYPFGLCGAPKEQDGITVNRLDRINRFIPHLKKMGVGAIYFCPVMMSDRHGYDTRCFYTIDSRLGSNADFAALCKTLHDHEIRVVLDGVFHHVGRGFWAFQDVMRNQGASRYKDWFYLDFGRNSRYNDGFWYEGWEGHDELVKLNLSNPDVLAHLFSAVCQWIDEFGIDGLRLDVAYSLPEHFLRQLRSVVKNKRADFFLLGEMIHGDYRRIVNPDMLDSATNYVCYKGIYSAFNSMNLFEIAHSLHHQFGPEHWTQYKDLKLFSFVDNHDVSRISSILTISQHLQAVYAVLFAMPGIPCIYYGSEWGISGHKSDGDDALRPEVLEPIENELTRFITLLCKIRKMNAPLMHGDFSNVTVQNRAWVFKRNLGEEAIYVAVNAGDTKARLALPYHGQAIECIADTTESIHGEAELEAFEAKIYKPIV